MRRRDYRTEQQGAAGEKIAKKLFTAKGWQVYGPENDAPHWIDFFAVDGKQKMYAVDVKTYGRRAKYPDTGIDKADLEAYQHLESNYMPVLILFIDPIENAIYYGKLSELKQVAKDEGNKVYFPLYSMQFVRRLTIGESRLIKTLVKPDNGRYEGCKLYFESHKPYTTKGIHAAQARNY